MFEHIYGHESVVQLLKKELERGTLPSAILFYGKPCSGRLTLALETAKALSCERLDSEFCTCVRCKQHRTLSYPFAMLLPQRDHNPELAAALDTLARKKSTASRLLFIHSVRRRIGSYHAAFLETAPQQKKNGFAAAYDIDELIEQILEMSVSEQFDEILKAAKEAVSLCRKLDNGVSKPLPVSYMRTIAQWLHSTPQQTKRIVLLEGVDKMNDSAANSLLKIIEEPPDNVFFILLAESRHAVLPTILSRVRTYFLAARSSQCEGDVIKDVYHDNPDKYNTLITFFREKQGIDCKAVRQQAEDFFFTALKRRVVSHLHIQEIITNIVKEGLRVIFFQELSVILEEEFLSGFLSDNDAVKIMELLNDAMHTAEVYNQGEALTMETLYYKIYDIL